VATASSIGGTPPRSLTMSAIGAAAAARAARPRSTLVQPDDAVGHGEDGIAVALRLEIFANEKCGGFAAREVKRKRLHEVLQVELVEGTGRDVADDRAERIDEHEARVSLVDLAHDAFESFFQAAFEEVFPEVDESNAVIDLIGVEEGELLLIAEHLERRLAENREIDRRPLLGGIGEHDLVREGRLAATRPARQQVEGELGQAPAQYTVEPLDSRGELGDDDRFVAHGLSPEGGSLGSASGQALCRSFQVKASPMNVDNRPMKFAVTPVTMSGGGSGERSFNEAQNWFNTASTGWPTSMGCSAGKAGLLNFTARTKRVWKPVSPMTGARCS
jgi:hypothetical protein